MLYLHRPIKLYFYFSLFFVLTSCTSIPDQADVTQIDTVDVVKKILCEAQYELRYNNKLKLRNGYRLGLSYDFDSTVKKTTLSNATFTFPVALGLFTVNLSKGGFVKTRLGEEEGTVTGTFQNIRNYQCNNTYSEPSPSKLHKRVYPATDRVGIGDVLEKYFELRDFSHSEIADYVRTITFTVDITGGIKNSTSLERSSGIKIDADIDLSGQRLDVHKLKIVITKSPPKATATVYEVRIVGDERKNGNKGFSQSNTEKNRSKTFLPQNFDPALQTLRRSKGQNTFEAIIDELKKKQ